MTTYGGLKEAHQKQIMNVWTLWSINEFPEEPKYAS